MKTSVLLVCLIVSVLGCLLIPTTAGAVYREYYLATDIEPQVFVWSQVFFLKPWGGNSPSMSYIEVCTEGGAKYSGRLVKISEYEIAISRGYTTARTGHGSENQVVIPKKNVVMAKIYW